MTTLFSKVLADLILFKSRTVLAVLSMAAGLFAVGTLVGLADIQHRVMDRTHKASQPSHINMLLRDSVDEATIEELRHLPGIAGIDPLSQLTVHVKSARQDTWQLATLVVRPDYARQVYDMMPQEYGRFPDDHEVAVERLSAAHSSLETGDYVSFKTGTQIYPAQIAGVIRHPFVKPPTFGGQLHFFARPGFATALGLPNGRYLQLLIRRAGDYDPERTRQLAHTVKTFLGKRGIGVNATLLQDPVRHWGHPFFAGINLVLQVMAWATLGMGAVLLQNTVASLLTQQADQIGILKALGARYRTIVQLYCGQVLILGCLALCIAIPTSLMAAYVSTRWLVDLFNVTLPHFEFSPTALLYTVLAGVLIPLLAAYPPIHRAARLPVSAALATYGLGSDYRAPAMGNYLPPLYALSWGHLFQYKRRLVWTQAGLILAGVTFLVVRSLLCSMHLTLDNEIARTQYDVRLGFTSEQPVASAVNIALQVPETLAVETWARYPVDLTLGGAPLKQAASLGAQLVALPTTSALYRPLVVHGRWLAANDAQQRVLVMNEDSARLNGLSLNDEIELIVNGHPGGKWTLIGTYRWLAGANFAVEPIYAPLEATMEVTHRNGFTSLLHVTANIETDSDESSFADRMKRAYSDNDINLDFYTSVAKREQRRYAQNQFKPVTGLLMGLSILIASVAAIGLSGALALGVLQRLREIGVLRSLGISTRRLYSVFMVEGLFHGVLSWLVSVPVAYLLANPLARRLGLTMLKVQLDYRFDYAATGQWLMLILTLSILASLWPALTAARLSPSAHLHY